MDVDNNLIQGPYVDGQEINGKFFYFDHPFWDVMPNCYQRPSDKMKRSRHYLFCGNLYNMDPTHIRYNI